MSREISLASPRILSDKSLEILTQSQIKLEQHNLLLIKPIQDLEFDMSWLGEDVLSVFTSIHALEALDLFFKKKNIQINNNKAIAIQGRTENRAKELGYDIIFASKSSRDFHKVENIDKFHKIFHFTTSNRLDNWKNHHRFHSCKIESIEVYEKKLNPIEFKPFDAVMFFSPSQAKAFFKKNKINYQDIFCIGETTGGYLKECGFKNIHLSEKPSEKVMVKTIINYYNGK